MFDDAQIERLLFLLTDQWLSQDTDNDLERSWKLFTDTVQRIDSPDELHVLAAHLNWDYGFTGLRSVAEHPHCDHGTVLMLFWLGNPRYTDRRDPDERQFLQMLCDRYVADDFRFRSIAFDPGRQSGGPLPPEFPDAMTLPCSGADRQGLVDAVGLLVTCEWYRRGHFATFPSPANPAIAARSGGAPDPEVVRILNRHGKSDHDRQKAANSIRELAIARIRSHA